MISEVEAIKNVDKGRRNICSQLMNVSEHLLIKKFSFRERYADTVMV